jgi:hypothetical protein
MKKNDSLKVKTLKPKKQTIDFLLNFSKSLEIVKSKSKNYPISKIKMTNFVLYENAARFFDLDNTLWDHRRNAYLTIKDLFENRKSVQSIRLTLKNFMLFITISTKTLGKDKRWNYRQRVFERTPFL